VKPTPTGRVIVDFLAGRMPAFIDTGWNLVDVQDVARGHLLAARNGRTGERYILGGENLMFRDTLGLLSEITGLPAPRWRLPYGVALAAAAVNTSLSWLTGRTPRIPLDGVRMARRPMYYDSTKAHRELGFVTRPVRQALEAAVAWFVERGYAPKPPTWRDSRLETRAWSPEDSTGSPNPERRTPAVT